MLPVAITPSPQEPDLAGLYAFPWWYSPQLCIYDEHDILFVPSRRLCTLVRPAEPASCLGLWYGMWLISGQAAHGHGPHRDDTICKSASVFMITPGTVDAG